jgi:hypothetical protein
MVDFHDRRRVALNAPKEATPDLPASSGVVLSRKVINDCFVVSSSTAPLIEGKRMYAVHEVLPTGETITRSDGHPTRYAAGKEARSLQPSSVRPLR